MSETFNIYCDESCHLEYDPHKVMVLGAIWCPLDKAREIATRLREIKVQHGLAPEFELKWGKVSKGKECYYRDVLDYFFDYDELHYRALVVTDKTKLRHEAFSQEHDTWYYKMYFVLLQVLFNPDSHYRIYLDKKDSLGGRKVEKLHEVLCNDMYDFDRRIIERVQIVTSDHIEQVQLCDFLTGAISYANRELSSNATKLSLINRMRERSRYSLRRTTLLRERKVNIFCWHPSEVTR